MFESENQIQLEPLTISQSLVKQEQTAEQLNECWKHIKPYMHDKSVQDTIYPMCSVCECWMGKEHKYEDCLHKACFKFFLSFEYLEWRNSYG